jgi:hypothetical protein
MTRHILLTACVQQKSILFFVSLSLFVCLPLDHSPSLIFSLFCSFCLYFSINLFSGRFCLSLPLCLNYSLSLCPFSLFLSFFYSLLFCLFLFLSLFLCSSLSLLFLSLSIYPLSILQYCSFSWTNFWFLSFYNLVFSSYVKSTPFLSVGKFTKS